MKVLILMQQLQELNLKIYVMIFLEKQWYAIARWINGIYNRARITWHVWVKGYATYESTTLLNQQQALNYAETLRQAIEDVDKIRSDRVKKFQHAPDSQS
jgi:hypothetical protein